MDLDPGDPAWIRIIYYLVFEYAWKVHNLASLHQNRTTKHYKVLLMRKMMFYQFFSLLECIGNVEQIRTPATHMNTDPYVIDSIRTGIHNPVYFMTLFTGEYCTQHQYWTSLVGLRVVAIMVFALQPHGAPFITFPSYDRRLNWLILKGFKFLESSVADPDPHGSALT